VVAETVKPFLEKKKHATLAIGVITPEEKRDFGFGTFALRRQGPAAGRTHPL